MIEQIYLYLILIGATIGVVLLLLWRQARSISGINLALIRLNEQRNFDTPAFLRDAWPLLSQAGLLGMAWQLDWFGTPVEGQAGRVEGASLSREIHVTEMKLAITLYHQNRRGERRYFDEALIETFLLLLRTDMWIKAGATDTTFRQMAKLNLFLQHDIKNIAQFIQLMADQVASIPPGKEQQVLNYLRTAAPLVRQRADRIVRTLTVGQAHDEPLRKLEIREVLTQLCNLHRLEYHISGAAEISAPENTLDRALDNILKNYSDFSLRSQTAKPTLDITVTPQEQGVDICIESPHPPEIQVERLFEPFWSSDPAGLGIGLYHAKQLLESYDGSLRATISDASKLQFLIHFPRLDNP